MTGLAGALRYLRGSRYIPLKRNLMTAGTGRLRAGPTTLV